MIDPFSALSGAPLGRVVYADTILQHQPPEPNVVTDPRHLIAPGVWLLALSLAPFMTPYADGAQESTDSLQFIPTAQLAILANGFYGRSVGLLSHASGSIDFYTSFSLLTVRSTVVAARIMSSCSQNLSAFHPCAVRRSSVSRSRA